MTDKTSYRSRSLNSARINELNLAGDGHVYGHLYCEDLQVNDTLTAEKLVVNDHLKVPTIETDTIQALSGTRIKIEDELDMANKNIINLSEPGMPSHAATRQYVDTAVSNITIPSSTDIIYRNPTSASITVIPNRWYYVAEIVTTNAEGSFIIVSRCLDPGSRQTIVLHVTILNGKSHLNLISNTFEDQAVFTKCSTGDDGQGDGGVLFYCANPSNSWEYRIYMNQDNSGTNGSYQSFFTFPQTMTLRTSDWSNPYKGIDLGINVLSTVSDVFSSESINTNSLTSSSINTPLITHTNGISITDSIDLNNKDIQGVNIIGANKYYTATLNSVLEIGTSSGPLYVDTQNNRVGIGISNPTEDLEIAGNIQLDTGNAGKIVFYDSQDGHKHCELTASDDGTNGGKLELKTKANGGGISTRLTIHEDGEISVANKKITGVSDPTVSADVATKNYVDTQFFQNPTGFVKNPLTSDLNTGSYKITSLTYTPTTPSEATSKYYVDNKIITELNSRLTNYVKNPMLSSLNAAGNSITNVGGLSATNTIETSGAITSGFNITANGSIYAGNALVNPVQGPVDIQLPLQTALGSGIMPRFFGGYLAPQSMTSSCLVTETVIASAAHKLNIVSSINTTNGAYNLTVNSGSLGTNLLITIPSALDNHLFNIQVDGEWNNTTIGGNGNSYIYIREDGNSNGDIIGMNTGQAISGARYPCCLNFTGRLPEGTYAILTGHYDLGASRIYNGNFRISYIGQF